MHLLVYEKTGVNIPGNSFNKKKDFKDDPFIEYINGIVFIN